MGLSRMLATSQFIDDLLHEFENSSPDINSSFDKMMSKCRIVLRSEGYDFHDIVNKLQEVTTRNILSSIELPVETNWDAVLEKETRRFVFSYENGGLMVFRKHKIPYQEKPSHSVFTEIDFNGTVNGMPIVGEVKSGLFNTSGHLAVASPCIKKKIYPIADYFHRPVAYVAVIPKDQIKVPDLFARLTRQEKFLARGGHLVAFPYERKEWQEIALETAISKGLEIDFETLPGRMKPGGIYHTYSIPNLGFSYS